MPPTSQNVKKRKSSKHDRTGCLTCRYRRKKCTENTFPACGACIRLNLECVRETRRQVVPSTNTFVDRTGSELDVTSISHAHMLDTFHYDWLPGTQNIETSSRRRYAMKYYIKVLAELLTVSRKYNSFLSEFLPMAMESPALAGAMVAWASGHLSGMDGCYRVTALEARSTALCELVKAISSAPDNIPSHETNAATCLVLLTSEVCLGNHTEWYNHLVGAKNIILAARVQTGTGKGMISGPDAFKGSPEGRWVLRNFAYHDILGSVTLGTKPLLRGTYLHDITDVIDTYLGVASEILMFISEISHLDPISIIGGDILLERGTNLEPFEIEWRLKSWRCHSSINPALTGLAYAYRSAALIYLYRRMRSFVRLYICSTLQDMLLDLDSKIRSEVSNTLRHLAKIPLHEISESALLFPLFLAGGEAIGETEVDVVRFRLRLMLEKRNFQNISRALGVLEEVWNRRAEQNSQVNNVDWQDIIDSQGCRLLLT